MHKLLTVLLLGFASALAFAATPEQEKQFVDTYKKAVEAKDAKTLGSLLYTKGADPQAVEFYKMMMAGDPNTKIVSIMLVALTPEDKARASKSMPGPGGKNMVLTLQPVKKLVIKSESKSKEGSSSGTSEVFVGEADGKLMIPVPGPAK
jgi:hypothetical protein